MISGGKAQKNPKRRLQAIIVDDEANAREMLIDLVQEFCPEVEVAAEAVDVAEAIECVGKYTPDLVFLDIMMPGRSGFDFLEQFEKRSFSVIFVTAFHQHALRAFKASAVDYILKPIDPQDLRNAVDKVLAINRQAHKPDPGSSLPPAQLRVLLENLGSDGIFGRLILNLPRGIKIVRKSDILCVVSEKHATLVFLSNGEKVIVTDTLKDYEEMLYKNYFCRIHKSSLVNLAHVSEYFQSTNNYAVLSNGQRLAVSRRRVKEFLDKLASYVSLSQGPGAVL